MLPLISIIIPTYNRVGTIGRTIDSILIQTYQNFEIIVVDDGSTDGTLNLLEQYAEPRIRVFKHDKNRRTAAATNTGLNNIKGEWFTVLSSDDEIISSALEVMINVPLEKDSGVNAVSCNCVDTMTGKFSGEGLEFDQYVNYKTLARCTGEFWGITKTELLGAHRLNENIYGFENILWFKINEKANRFYVHKALRIYHTEGDDRMRKATYSVKQVAAHYESLINERHYIETLKEKGPKVFTAICLRAVVFLIADNQRQNARFYYQYGLEAKSSVFQKIILSCAYISSPSLIRFFTKIRKMLK